MGGQIHAEADIRRHHRVSVLAIYRGPEMSMDITADTKLRADDNLLVLGRRKDVEAVEEMA